ncbi:acyl-CoA synthetase [Gordonia hongkongensis]|uniref:Acyl-CoA synthetase n=1 Tax=Gordonia hongkongensis TaxID=1701090 RepID=A0AAX3T760_9ACTN|nr:MULTISPECIES: acyl-CoA synthetase [Gordonia]MBR7194101.1 acyl-CoA synthetase [Gordonia sp. SCSIO 19800]MCX2753748.1 acyl-CoA synthetase [Gordonia sp. 4N]QIK46546.1 acyl-CoA synthetase [Gordonia terrae]WFP24457.1 acyl-CoA synthetase [Gordonia hongkongensis]
MRATTTGAEAALWPVYDAPADLADIELTPLSERGLPDTTYQALHRAAQLWPERTAIRVMPDAAGWQQTTDRTYAQLLATVDRHAATLRAADVGPQDPVTLLAPNCAGLIEAFLAAQRAGIAAPINPAMDARHVGELIRRSGSRVLIAAGPDLDPAMFGGLADILAATDVDTVFLLPPTGAGAPPAPPNLAHAIAVAYLDADDHPRTEVTDDHTADDVAALFHTGGTTGVPKLAAHTHRNEISNAWMIAANTVLDEDSVVFAALPLFHVNALIVTVLAPMLRGQTVVWAGPLGYRDVALYGVFWQLVQAQRIAGMSAVPTVYAVLAQCPVDADISSLRACLVGASMLPPAVRSDFESHTGVPLLEGYGLTEATCASVRSYLQGQPDGSVGQRMPYQHIRAVDDQWDDVPTGSTGRLLVTGPTVFAGYVRGRTAAGFHLDDGGAIRDGWLDTGDLGSVDADGFVTLTGRAKDLIIRGGHNIDPRAVEDVLLEHPEVTGAGVVGRPDVHSGEVPVAFVTVRADGTVTGDGLRAWATERVSEAAAAPKAVTIVDALPVTDVGKPYKLALRAQATQATLSVALAGAGIESEVRAQITDGVVVANVDRPREESLAARVLDAYAIQWQWSDRTETPRA